jgi:hypothetical protein
MESTMAKTSKTQTIETNDVANLATVIEQAPTMVQTIAHDYNKLLETHKTKSAIIRLLSAEGHKNGPIAKFMGIKYQFVRNVLIQPVKKQTA